MTVSIIGKLAMEWQGVLAKARRLGYSDDEIEAAVQAWKETPYDRDWFWQRLTSKAPGAR